MTDKDKKIKEEREKLEEENKESTTINSQFEEIDP